MKRLFAFAAGAMLAFSPIRSFASCESAVYRQFDFWLGNWRVTNAGGKVIGHDIVSKRLGGCAVYEEYHDANDPSVGIGLIGYDSSRGRWHQSFMDDAGFVLDLDGSLQNGAMVFEGTDYPNGKPRLNRGVWTKRGDAVEELWTISTDGGRIWTTRFDGWFHRLT